MYTAVGERVPTMKQKVSGIFRESAKVKEQFVEDHAEAIVEVARLIAAAFSEGGKLLSSAMAAVPPTPRT